MPPKRVVTLPSSVLRKSAGEVPVAEIPSARVQRLISDMKQTLVASPDGIGLAAPQVGVLLRIFIVSEEAAHIGSGQEPVNSVRNRVSNGANREREREQWRYFVFINPVLKKSSRKKIEMAEGCLSVPGKFGQVQRAEKVLIEWHDEHGRKHARGFTGFFARVIQHEMDHLDGVLIVDRAKKLFTMTTPT